MNLTWHIIKKDLSRFWLGIVFVVGLAALKIFLIHGNGVQRLKGRGCLSC